MMRIGFLVLLFVLPTISWTCDVCGCTLGNQFLGVLPLYQRHIIGMRYLNKSFDIYHPKIFIDDVETTSKDRLTQIDLWYRFQWNSNFQILAFVPYKVYEQKENTSSFTNTGLGDISILANFTVLDITTKLDFRHTMQLGGGLKLPTGGNKAVQNGVVLSQFKQMGSGTVDFPLQMQWIMRKSSHGLKLEGQYKWNLTNADGYKYGNSLSAALDYIYWRESANMKIIPQIGLALDYIPKDRKNGFAVDLTGVSALYAKISIDAYYKNIGFGFSVQSPLKQTQGDGFINENVRTHARLLYFF